MPDILFVTANVGSLFDDNVTIRSQWKDEMVSTIVNHSGKFVVMHFQETGGKNFTLYSKDVPGIVIDLYESLRPHGFSSVRAFLDMDYENIDEYTALGTVVFIHESWIGKIKQWRFISETEGTFESIQSNEQMIERTVTDCEFVRKKKFAKDFWRSIRWGRKGYLHTRWLIDDQDYDLINIHLFHDESNLELTQNPHLYSKNRKRALNYTVEEYLKWKSVFAPGEKYYLFIFGDFNFRLRTDSFLRRITKDREVQQIEEYHNHKTSKDLNNVNNRVNNHLNNKNHDGIKRNLSAIEFRPKIYADDETADDSSIVLRIEKKVFDYIASENFVNNWCQYRDDDREIHDFEQLRELPIQFPPTYPWSEDPQSSNCFMKTRPPAWCDRVLMNDDAYDLAIRDSQVVYDCVGLASCMGDHKPVLLGFNVPAS